ncbi:MAG: hypothetical protein ACI4M6_01945 [Christensenellaceae bacterium]
MKRLLGLILTFALCLTLVACSPSFKSTVTDYSSGEVTSNGGFAVEKGEYVYFINGVEQKTASNTFGQVEKGALYRMKKSEIGSGVKAELVIPKVMYANRNGVNNGIFIFGDYVYYATPSNRKDSAGDVMTSSTEFTKTKLDGTDSKIIATIKDSDEYRFVKSGENVYLVLNTSNDDGDSVLRVYNADNQTMVYETKAITSYMLSDDISSEYAFYTAKVHNEQTDSDESFNALHMLKLDGSSDVEILVGAGTYSDAENGIGIAGVTFQLVAVTDKLLVLTQTTVATSDAKMYYGIKIGDVVTEQTGETPITKTNSDNLVLLDKGTSFASSIFADTSIYVDLDCILYFDASYGLVKYDYTKVNEDFGRQRVYYDEKMLSSTMKFVKGGYVYMVDESVVYYRFKLDEVIDLTTKQVKNATTKFERLNYITLTESWYLPEIVGDYMLANLDSSPYNGYVYAIDLKATSGMTESEIEDYSEDQQVEDRAHLLAREKMLVGAKTAADGNAFTEYLDDHYPEETEDSASA